MLERLASICEGDVAVCPQTESEATEAPKITQSESIIDFNKMTAFEVHNHVRAFAEWPGSWATFTSNSGLHRVKLITTQLLPQVDSNNEEDDILKVKLIKSKNCIQIRCQDGAYIGVSEVQPEHRKVMDAKSFWNGLRGELLYRQ